MPREAVPRFDRKRKVWVAQVGGRRHTLTRKGEPKAEAWRRLREIQAERQPGGDGRDATVLWICVQYRKHLDAKVERGEITPAARDKTVSVLRRWCAHGDTGAVLCSALQPHHVTAWLDAQGRRFNGTTRFEYSCDIKAAFAWAVRAGHLRRHPLAGMEPAGKRQRRGQIPTSEQLDRVREHIRADWLRDLFDLLRLTGARPSELSRMTAADVRDGVVVLAEHKTAGTTGQARRIYLPPEAQAIIARLALAHPTGPLLRSRDGGRLIPGTITAMFRRLSKQSGIKVTAYQLRHRFVSDLVKREPLPVVSRLVGHVRITTTENYVHHDDADRDLREAVARIRTATEARSGRPSAPPDPAGDAGPKPTDGVEGRASPPCDGDPGTA